MEKLKNTKENLAGFKKRVFSTDYNNTLGCYQYGGSCCYGDKFVISSARSPRCRKHNLMLFIREVYKGSNEFVTKI